MRFLGTKDKGLVKLIGFPLDVTTTYRPGTRFAYERVVNASQAIETYSPYLDADIEDFPICDLGQVELPFGTIREALTTIEKTVEEIDGPFLAVGGEHLITYPVVKALLNRYEELTILHIDAHADLRDSYLGTKLSHATVMRRVVELGTSVVSIGVRSFTKEELEFLKMVNNPIVRPFNLDFSVLKTIEGRRVYISFDVDVIDPAFCPGVGTPEPGGLSVRDIIELLKLLDTIDFNLVGADIVELNPMVDPTGNSDVLGAFLVREFLLLISKKLEKGG